MTRSRVQSFWHGDQLSPYEIMCIRSFLHHGHAFDLYSYASDLNVPVGCNLLDAGLIFPEDQAFFYRSGPEKGSLSLFSNAFRYRLLEHKGGWWVDLDVVCQARNLPEDAYVFGFEGTQGKIGTAVIKMPAGDPLMALCAEKSLEVGDKALWGQSGPDLFTGSVNALGLTKHARPVSTFYPHSWTEAMDVFDPAQTERLLASCAQSTFVHLWAEVLRRARVDKFAPPPMGSVVDRFFGLYDPEQQEEFGLKRQLCSNRQACLAALSIKAPVHEKLANLIIAARRMSNTKHYIRAIGCAPNYVNPTAYSEKMQCRKLFDRNPVLPEFCDKLKAIDHAENIDTAVRVPQVYWSGTDPESIPFDTLPTPYIVKPNHRSGEKVVVRDRSDEKRSEIRNRCRSWLKHPHGLDIEEWGYRKVEPRLFAEELLPAPAGFAFPDDYRMFVFSGRVEFIQIFRGRETDVRWRGYFDRNWKWLDIQKWLGWATSVDRARNSLLHAAVPKGLDTMIKASEEIGRNLDHIRVDFYDIDGEVYLGEMTPYPDSGFAYCFSEDATYDVYPPRDIDCQNGALWNQPQIPLLEKLKRVLTG